MTNHVPCLYGDRRESAIIDYVYRDVEVDARSHFEEHLATCLPCRREVDELRGVRVALADWAPPEPMRALEHSFGGPRLADAAAASPHPGGVRPWAAMPAWAKMAAAVLCLGVGAGAANLRVTYSSDAVTVTTGWAAPPALAPALAAPAWQAELTALERSLRDELRSVRTSPRQPAGDRAASAAAEAPGSPDPLDGDTVMRQVKALIARSEQRQQNELALRLGGVLAEVQNQRRADLARIDQTIGVVQSNTGMEVLRQREMLNSLAVRVSTQR